MGGSSHARPQLVEHTDERAVWRSVVTVQASPERHRQRREPCSAESIAPVGEASRTCDTSVGVRVDVGTAHGARGAGVTVVERDEPVDCATPCPPNPDLEVVRALNGRYAGRWFARPEEPRAALFASESACDAADVPTFPGDGPEACDPDPAPWEDRP